MKIMEVLSSRGFSDGLACVSGIVIAGTLAFGIANASTIFLALTIAVASAVHVYIGD